AIPARAAAEGRPFFICRHREAALIMIATMNKREKFLLTLTVVVVGVLVNFYLIKFFLSKRSDLGRQLAVTQAKIDTLKKRESERELWSRRDAWLNEKLPVLGDDDVASKEFRES